VNSSVARSAPTRRSSRRRTSGSTDGRDALPGRVPAGGGFRRTADSGG
jgi:hypothetical protein